MSACRSCGAPIRWARTERDRRMPLDAEPYDGASERGLFVLRPGSPFTTALAVPSRATFPGEPVFRSHFATCPQAAEHRRRA